MNMNFTKFPSPVLGDDLQKLYTTLYGDAGSKFIDILNTSPDEIAVISRLVAYITYKRGAEKNGYSENSK